MLTGATRLVGLLGSPVSHSLSPRMQNAAFAARDSTGRTCRSRFRPSGWRPQWPGWPRSATSARATIPHKTAVLAYCDELDPFAERAGSANTLVVRDGRVLASSTDGLAVADAVDAAGARVLPLGAGGAAQAVATALLEAGATALVVAARRPEAAGALAARLHTLFPGREVGSADGWPPHADGATLLVNTTPLREESPSSPQRAKPSSASPTGRTAEGRTALVAAARGPVVDGLEVLVQQGAASFERWTGLPAPVDVMRAAVRSPA